ncbi:MAG: tetratricopeptide repeat protein, partial [Planctomycetota bacterium]|nr:tetratricopeptide repeat protein [Planctomycetota bacterium]
FLAGQCQYKMEAFKEAADIFEKLVKEYNEARDVRPEAMYWLADSQFKIRDYVNSYRNFKKLTWDYPENIWAKRARGRLTEEVFVKIEE